MEKITINIDFDGTCTTHDFPHVGREIGAESVLRKLTDNGHNLILFTMRNDSDDVLNEHFEVVKHGVKYLTDAVNWFLDNDIPLYGIQKNPTQHMWTSSPKSYAQMMIDDSAIFTPLIYNPTYSDRPYVDWNKIEAELIRLGLINE